MKKVYTLVLSVLLLLGLFTSCTQEKTPKIEYPEIYTPEYCANNYVPADGQLIVTGVLENYIGGGENYPKNIKKRYYGIKDIPFDSYLMSKEGAILGSIDELVINKSLGIQKQEVLVYEIEKIEIYYIASNDDNTSDSTKKVLVLFDKEESKKFQYYLNEVIDSQSYTTSSDLRAQASRPEMSAPSFIHVMAQNKEVVEFKVYFSSYSNMYWHSFIEELDRVPGEHYIRFGLYDDYGTDSQDSTPVYIPLGEALSTQIREAIEAN